MATFLRVGPSDTYSTTFDATENPLLQNSAWLNGLTVGKDWSDVQTSGGIACGTQTGPAAPPFDDSIALWTPPNGVPWTDTQIEAQVVIPDRTGWTGDHEVELLLRGTLTSNSAKFYEVQFAVNAGTTYRAIVRWNGALSDFTFLVGQTFDLTINDGDWIKATIIGTVITMYRGVTRGSYVQIGSSYDTASDGTKYASGFPGYGHWRNDGETIPITAWGITSWSATRL